MARIARLGVVIDSSGAKKGADEVKSSLSQVDQSAKRASDELKKAGKALDPSAIKKAAQDAAKAVQPIEPAAQRAAEALKKAGDALDAGRVQQAAQAAAQALQPVEPAAKRAADELRKASDALDGDRIRQAAQEAARAVTPIEPAAKRAADELKKAGAALDPSAIQQAAGGATKSLSTVDAAGKRTEGVLQRTGRALDFTPSRRSAEDAKKSLTEIDKTAERAVAQLKKAAGALGIAFGLRGIQQAVDTYTLLDGRLKQVAGSSQAAAQAQTALFQIAQNARQTYAGTVDLYTRMARSSDQLGLSQTQLLSVTEAVSNATRLSNATQMAAAQAQNQLGQAFASGVLRGEELNSIMEQLPEVAKAIADGLGVPIGKLREMGQAGELSGRQVALALDSQREKLALLAGEIPTTIGGALTQLNNAFGMVVAGSNEAKSATAGIAGVLGEAARAMIEYRDAVVAVTIALGAGGLVLAATKAGAALAATAGGATVLAFASQVTAITSVSNALAFMQLAAGAAWRALLGPVGLAITAITAVAAAVFLWRRRQQEAVPAIEATTKSLADQRAEAERLAKANFVPPSLVRDIEAAGGALAAFRQGGKSAADAFKMANEAWSDGTTANRSFTKALAEGDAKAKATLQTATALTAMNGQMERAVDRTTKATEAAAKAAAARAEIERDYQASVVQLGIELAQRAYDRQVAYTQSITDGAAAFSVMQTARARDNAQLREQIAALSVSGIAYNEVTRAQQLQAGVAEALTMATKAGIELTPLVIGGLVNQVAESQRLLRVKEALAALDGKNPFEIPEKTKTDTQAWADGLRDVIGVVQLIAQAFGEVGRTISLVATGAQSITTGLARAQSIKNAEGKSVSFGDALGGKAGAAGTMAAFSSAGAFIGGVTQIADALDLFGTRAKEKARKMREDAIAFNRALEDFAITARTSLEEALRRNLAQAEQLAKQAASATGITGGTIRLNSADDLRAQIDQLSGIADFAARRGQNAFANYRAELERVLETVLANEAALREQNARELARLNEDLEVRRLVAAGLTEAADAERLRLQQLREVAEIEAKFGKDSPYLVQLRDVQAAELAAAEAARVRVEAERAATQAREREAFGLDLVGRRQTLNGDERGAFITGQTVGANSALAQAQALVEAGTITADMFEQLKVLLGDEMVAAIRAFDNAVAEAKLQQTEDLAVRALVAQGRGAEAEQMRIDIANRRELAGITDASIIAQIEYVQQLEAVGRATASLAAQAQLVAEQNASIDARMLDAYRTLDPARARELEQKQREVDRSAELAAAADESTRARLRELYAMQDAAAAVQEVTRAFEDQQKAAQELADFTRSIDSQYKRSQGKNFEADVSDLEAWRTNERKKATQLGAGTDTFAQIDAIYNARYQELIADTMKKAADAMPVSTATSGTPGEIYRATPERVTVLDEERTSVRSARSISESSAVQLVDYAASQTAIQRRILQLMEARSEGGSSSGVGTMTSDRALGVKARRTAMMVNGVVR
jgi:tape measure domain-containing protein